jgi:hypothetical protein
MKVGNMFGEHIFAIVMELRHYGELKLKEL